MLHFCSRFESVSSSEVELNANLRTLTLVEKKGEGRRTLFVLSDSQAHGANDSQEEYEKQILPAFATYYHFDHPISL